MLWVRGVHPSRYGLTRQHCTTTLLAMPPLLGIARGEQPRQGLGIATWITAVAVDILNHDFERSPGSGVRWGSWSSRAKLAAELVDRVGCVGELLLGRRRPGGRGPAV